MRPLRPCRDVVCDDAKMSVSEFGVERCGRDCRRERRKLSEWPGCHLGGDIRQQLDLRRLRRCLWRYGHDTGMPFANVCVHTEEGSNSVSKSFSRTNTTWNIVRSVSQIPSSFGAPSIFLVSFHLWEKKNTCLHQVYKSSMPASSFLVRPVYA